MQVLENTLSWIPKEALFRYSIEETIWKAREDFRSRYLQKKVVYGLLFLQEGVLYFCGEQLALVGNFFGFNLLETPIRNVPDLCRPFEPDWKWDPEKDSLYARDFWKDTKRIYDVDIFRQYPPMGTGPAWRLDRFSCEQKHKFLFYTIRQGKKVCPKCFV
ncbi:MAG: hypothetical protein AABZ60_17095 [Planctomycetota bacterium]